MSVHREVPGRAVAIYAHPDDPEVSCGGALAAWAAAGAEVHVVIATQGEKGSGDADTDPDALADERADEVARAADVLGAVSHRLLGWPDGELDNTLDLRRSLVGLLRELQPEVVVAPDPTAVFFGDGYVNHRDHRELGWAVLDAVAPAASSPLYFSDQGPPHQVRDLLLSGTLTPDLWVDIGDSLDIKVAALLCHHTQLGDGAEEWVPDFIRERAADAGRQAGVPHAEGFRRIRLVR